MAGPPSNATAHHSSKTPMTDHLHYFFLVTHNGGSWVIFQIGFMGFLSFRFWVVVFVVVGSIRNIWW